MSPKVLSSVLGIAAICCLLGALALKEGSSYKAAYLAGGFTAFGITAAVVGLVDAVARMKQQ
jgi:hypothetical protein